MTDAKLFQWPSRARYGRVVPKNKFYEQGVSPKVRGRFVSEVNRIRWAYKLAEETIQLSGNDSVPEIQVFEIETRCDDVSDDVLQALDTAVPYPVIIEISRRNRDQPQTRMTACYKDLGKTKPNLSGYFTSGWIAEPAERVPLPAALDLQSLFTGLVLPILPFPARHGESLSEATDRLDQAHKLQREISGLERKLRNEVQFNRKVQLRRQLHAQTAALNELVNSPLSKPNIKDPQWTS
ncbi:DUF4391 domain-containing protein [Candidatus Microthrix parvicella]|jgi:hypothetical protein|uniref:Methyl-accepting chemotaxis protein n=1 Tax=Candidatus Neomicrothrix parvicella RN1 TaxID=1229780 RepID=R4Z0W8_9ACTN|nr:DUF4391 domain-containing protein [Candidatus Microthrix parvicella]CCM64353.1 conserved hypothetical protein [Candidatus Microthrix parvicella RN1]